MSSWDRFEVPRPFSRAIFLYGEPFTVPRELDEAGREYWRAELESRLNRLAIEVEQNFDELWSGSRPPSFVLRAPSEKTENGQRARENE